MSATREPKSDASRLPRLILVALFAAVVGYTAILGFTDLQHKREMLATIQNALSEELVAVAVSSNPACHKSSLMMHTSNATVLQRFRQALQQADTGSFSGHSGPVVEVHLELRFSSMTLRYLASIHQYEPRDVFITDEPWVPCADGHVRNRVRYVRLPYLAGCLNECLLTAEAASATEPR